MNNNKIKDKIITQKAEFNSHTIEFEVGRFAEQANAAVMGRMGDTMVLVTVVCGGTRDDIDWFPLQVEYQEKLYAGGIIKGSRWVKREGRPSDDAILTARLIDRSIRPLFPKDFKQEVQVVATVLSVDGENDPDVIALCTASAALSISNIPFHGPVAAIRVGEKNGQFVTNPVYEIMEQSKLDLVVAATAEALVMVEAGAKELPEDKMIEALEYGQKQNQTIVKAISELVKKVGKPKTLVVKQSVDQKFAANLIKKFKPQLTKLTIKSEDERQNREAMRDLIDQAMVEFPDNKKKEIGNILFDELKKMLRLQVLSKNIRSDGRKPDQIRQINAQVDILARTHGSAMFKRGATQALSIITLGPPSLEQMIESMEGEDTKRYMHHYVFPPYSVGECGRMGWPSRREIGHGALAERALMPVIPDEDAFPYAIRIVSEIMSSNGSTSMASVCGSTLCLMDAGVPIKKPVAGIAMGLVKDEKSDKHIVLTDITGQEDHIGDMDFKVAGTKDGITALQMDIKINGVSSNLLREALAAAKKARLFILDKMLSVLPEPRKTLSKYAPQIATLHIEQEKIGEVIGPGGRMIRKIIAETGTMVDVDDDGRVTVTGQNKEGVNKAIEWIDGLTREVNPGEIFEDAEVKRILDFGAFVEFLPGKEGMVHVSKISPDYIKHPSDKLAVGDKVKVHVEEVDKMGRINLSMLFDQEGRPMSAPRRERNNFDRNRNRRDRKPNFDRSRRDRKPRY